MIWEEHASEPDTHSSLVCRPVREKKKRVDKIQYFLTCSIALTSQFCINEHKHDAARRTSINKRETSYKNNYWP